jgi:hypothetical protein
LWHRLRSKPRRVNSLPVSRKNTERKVHLWAAEETGATEVAARSVTAAAGAVEQDVAGAGAVEQEPEAGTRDVRTREAAGEAAARTKRDTGRRSTSASTGWPNVWSDSKKRCASCAAAVTGRAPEALRNRGWGRRSPGPASLLFTQVPRRGVLGSSLKITSSLDAGLAATR